jgi:hypothetical protein
VRKESEGFEKRNKNKKRNPKKERTRFPALALGNVETIVIHGVMALL